MCSRFRFSVADQVSDALDVLVVVKARVRGGLAMCILAFSGCGAGAREFFLGATTLWDPFFVTMLMCHV